MNFLRETRSPRLDSESFDPFSAGLLFATGSSRLPRPDLPSFHWCSLSAGSLF